MIGDIPVPPGLILIVAGLVLTIARGVLRTPIMLAAPLLMLYVVWNLPEGNLLPVSYLTYELEFLRVDALSKLFGIVFSIMAFAGALFALKQTNTMEISAAFVYAGSALGVVFAGDLITVFIFWEIMAIASTLVIWAGGARAREAGLRYIMIHFLGGVLLMAGVAGHVLLGGSVTFEAMSADSWPRILILVGFLINAGALPMNAWLPDAYPRASWSGAVFLSAFTTKTAIYVLLRGFPGEEVLIWFGLAMVIYGIVFAVLENDMRRILAFAIINQVGFMMVGAGVGSEYGVNGAAAQAFIHILYKGLLFMTAGVIIYQTGRHKLTELGGLGAILPLTAVFAIVGAATTAGVPFTGSFTTKSLILKGVEDEQLTMVWYLLTGASAGALMNAGLKYPWFVFFSKPTEQKPERVPLSMTLAMSLLAFLCIITGIFPRLVTDLLPFPVDYEAYTASKILAQLQLLAFGAVGFFVLIRFLKPENTITIDTDWVYRGLGKIMRAGFNAVTSSLWGVIVYAATAVAEKAVSTVYRWHGPQGVFAETWSTGRMALWTTILLGLFCVIYFI